MNRKPIRVLMAKPGLDGHESGAKVIAALWRMPVWKWSTQEPGKHRR